MKKLIITITGPSLSGKSHLESMLLEGGVAAKATSITTRQPRAGEVDGQDYYFLKMDAFLKMADDKEMVEYVFFDKNFYGVSKNEVEKKFESGLPVAIVVEPNGAIQIKDFCEEQGWQCLQVFVANPEEVIRARFDERFKNDSLADPKVYANRWEAMKTVEKQWREKMAHADLFFERFDSSNQTQVMNEVATKAKEMTQKSRLKP
jgi:guanylate kinase